MTQGFGIILAIQSPIATMCMLFFLGVGEWDSSMVPAHPIQSDGNEHPHTSYHGGGTCISIVP